MLEKMYELFCQDKQNYLLYVGVCISECPQSEVPLYMGNAKADPLIPRPLSKQTGRYRQYDMTVTAAHIFCASCV